MNHFEEVDDTGGPSSISGLSPDFRSELAERLAELAPEVVADGKVDVPKLLELLGDDAVDVTERFGLFWPGKRRALKAAQEPTSATLVPDVENSKEWDTTKNLFIEGDNLEVLKVLQRHYHNKVKMIFIDPPYNTGKDFVYPDNFKEGLDTYLEWTRQVNDEGKKVSTNSETEGRYHSNWLNMMYPRLKLARNLLSDDGVIFISIDDVEVAHLRKLLDELFGEVNFVANIVWQSRTSISDDHEVSRNHNHVLAYSKDRAKLTFWGLAIDASEYKNPDKDERGPWKLVPLDANKPGGDTLYGVVNPQSGTEHFPPSGRSWAINRNEMQRLLDDGRVMFGLRGDSAPKRKLFLEERLERGDTKTPSSVMLDAATTKEGTLEVSELFGSKKIFDYPKPTRFLSRLLQFGSRPSEPHLVLDFFAGSSSAAHAVMALNAEDGGSRRFVMVQLPEPTPEGSEARKAGFATIADVSRERIRRAGAAIVAEQASQLESRESPLDVGFRAYKLADSNFMKWHVSSDVEPGKLGEHLLELRDSAADDATPEMLLTELLLKLGMSLTEDVEVVDVDGLRVFSVGGGALMAYLDEHVKPTLDQLKAVIATGPAKLIVLEDALKGNDELKTNLAQHCKTHNIELWSA